MDKQFLDGAVTLRTLPRHEAVAGQVTDGRITTPAGELAVILNGPTLRYLAAIEFTSGSSRGNHVHHRKAQWLYVVSGKLEAIVKQVKTGMVATFSLEAGDLVQIQPEVAHAFTGLTHALAIEACAEAYDPSDTTAYQLTTKAA